VRPTSQDIIGTYYPAGTEDDGKTRTAGFYEDITAHVEGARPDVHPWLLARGENNEVRPLAPLNQQGDQTVVGVKVFKLELTTTPT
jgi:hypothetical protein